jgi:hypothetical protein
MCARAYPAVLEGLLPALAVLTHADDDVEAIVTRIQALSVALGAIADEGESVVLEVVVELGEGPVAALVDDLFGARKVERLDATNGL